MYIPHVLLYCSSLIYFIRYFKICCLVRGEVSDHLGLRSAEEAVQVGVRLQAELHEGHLRRLEAVREELPVEVLEQEFKKISREISRDFISFYQILTWFSVILKDVNMILSCF